MTAHWNPEGLLDFRGTPRFGSGGIQCHGRNGGYGPRCRWTKGGRDDEEPDVRTAKALIQSMATQSPSQVTLGNLQELARLCLCRDHHMTQDQIARLAKKWKTVVDEQTASASVASSATLINPSPAPVEAHQFKTGWQGTNWQAALSSQVRSVGDGSGSQSQYPNGQAGIAGKDYASREHEREELAALQTKLSALQIENKGLREKEHRLGALVLQHSTSERQTKEESAAIQTKLTALQIENKDLREKERRLGALVLEHSTSERQTKEELRTAKEDLVTANNTLRATKEALRTAKEDLKTAKEDLRVTKEDLVASTKEQLSRAVAENQKLKGEKDRRLQALQDQHDALKKNEGSLESLIRQKDAKLREAKEENSRLQSDLELAEARAISQQTDFKATASSNGVPEKKSRSWFRRLQGGFKKLGSSF
jgi:myosin heavy subunit